MTVTKDDPLWLQIAWAEKERGVYEFLGPNKSNPRIEEYHRATRGSDAINNDQTPWCASFVCWCLEEAGIRSTRSKSARSFKLWGKELAKPERGCIVVLSRGKSPLNGHVGFYMGTDEIGWLRLLGGNQHNAVKLSEYNKNRVLSYRWPDTR